MQKIVTIFIVASTFLLAGCGDKEPSSEKTSEAPKTYPAPAQHPDQVGSMGKSTKGSW